MTFLILKNIDIKACKQEKEKEEKHFTIKINL